tara:strand:- start:2822 stop:2950 length:129 start_codon:yes stop_codon:yes gene_type:complete
VKKINKNAGLGMMISRVPVKLKAVTHVLINNLISKEETVCCV